MAEAHDPRDLAFASSAGAVAHVFVESLDDILYVTGEDGHHLQRVRRLRVGERVTAADGDGRWRAYEATRSEHGSVVLAVDGEIHREPVLAPALAVAFALSKGPKPETVVSGLTELGVDRIVPFRSERSVVRWEGDRVTTATNRLRRVAREAAMQCRRARLPEIGEPANFDDLVAHPAIVVGDPLGSPVASLAMPGTGLEWLVVVGPEGGLSDAEREHLAARSGATRVAVGPHVLRTETAAVAIAAALTARRRPGPWGPIGHGA